MLARDSPYHLDANDVPFARPIEHPCSLLPSFWGFAIAIEDCFLDSAKRRAGVFEDGR
jgi:hypothetical protein